MSNVLRQSDVTIVELGSSYQSLDDEALQQFGELLLGEATAAEPARLVVDLSSTDYIASNFLELLVRAWKRIKQRGGLMALSGVHPFCVEILRVTRLHTLWPVYPTRDEAVAALADSATGGSEAGENERAG